MSTHKPAIVLIHGAYHGPWCWERILPRLHSAGYEVHTPLLPSCSGPRDPPVTTHLDDVKHLHTLLDQLVVREGKNILLVAHSYGGMPASGAVAGYEKGSSGRSNGIVGVVFLTAYARLLGESLLNNAAPNIPQHLFEPHPDNPMYARPTPDGAAYFYSETEEAVAKSFVDRVGYMARPAAVSGAVEVAWRHVPCSYVLCTLDKAVTLQMQEEMVGKANADAKFPFTMYRLETDHSPFVNKVDELVWIVRKAAGEAWADI